MTITTIDRNTLRTINADIAAALIAVGTKHGIVFTQGKSHYGGPTGDVLVKFACADATTGTAALSWVVTHMIRLSGLTTDTCFWPSSGYSRGQAGKWKIVDYNSRAHKMPWIVQREGDMKRFKVPDATVKAIFGVTVRIPSSPPVIPVNAVANAAAAGASIAPKPRFDTSKLYEDAEF